MKNLKHYVLALMTVSAACVAAQTVTVASIEKVALPQAGYHPVLIDNGDKVLLTSDDYMGLRELDLTTGETRVISTLPKAGYGVSVQAGRLTSERTENSVFAVSTDDLKISVCRGGNVTVIAPNGPDRRYIWPSVSPDGRKIVYTVSGVGTYVCNLDGSQPVSLGVLRAPKWVNDEWVVGMNNSTVAGKTESSVDMVSADGAMRYTLTPSDIVSMYPSAMGNKIAFSTDRGEVYIMEITINE